jgi:hypothetical protein
MGLCRKYGFYLTGCSKWNGGDTLKICGICLSEPEKRGLIYPLKKTPIKKQYNTIKTRSTMVKTVPILGEGGE